MYESSDGVSDCIDSVLGATNSIANRTICPAVESCRRHSNRSKVDAHQPLNFM